MVTTDHLSLFPEELIDAICAKFNRMDMVNFRLTSRAFEHKSARQINYPPSRFASTNYKPLLWLGRFIPVFSALQSLCITGGEHLEERKIFTLLARSAYFPDLRSLFNHSTKLEEFYTQDISISTPQFSGDFLDLLRALTRLPVLLSIDFIQGSVRPKLHYLDRDGNLLGDIFWRVCIKEATPAAFHVSLEGEIAATQHDLRRNY
ncbi:hypothetical protein K505DRAFT_108902 [Melanomma pulvis-pyrius CBS 109.77]|uniref:F-box domain-containing protein n=1 Tax=Melanomma pulvis-pyrius CBS 109.77 TaxID=1314802 RepID=A0A6A6XQZ1_9PLEO|nr:hypothetical protein K505DRAFT_108902 [Melanomma pulvis-pyrius CBS 109.77]